MSRTASRPPRRTAAATVELALMLPVMFTLVFGCLEICQRLILRQTATVAAYETARLAARRTVTADRAIARGESILEVRRVLGGQVTIDPAELENLPTTGEIRITVRVPIEGNTPIQYVLPISGEITVSATMLRE